jgi:dynein heavy chain, axonemal
MPPSPHSELVLFDDALRHLIRISRCLSLECGHALLIGVGGSGKRSLTKLAASLVGESVFVLQTNALRGLTVLKEVLPNG